MIDPFIVTTIAGFTGLLIVIYVSRDPFLVTVSGVVYLLLLIGMSFAAGYPTNSSFPSHAIVYGLTQDHVWAAPKDNPYPPRSYIFKAPSEWHEERDKRKGHPFEVEKMEENKQQADQGTNPTDRQSKGEWVIHQHILPPKDE